MGFLLQVLAITVYLINSGVVQSTINIIILTTINNNNDASNAIPISSLTQDVVSAATNVVQIKSLSALTHSDQAGLTINLNNMIIKVTFIQGSGGRSATCSTPRRANFATKLLSTVSFTNFLTINQAIGLINIAYLNCFYFSSVNQSVCDGARLLLLGLANLSRRLAEDLSQGILGCESYHHDQHDHEDNLMIHLPGRQFVCSLRL